MAPHRKTHHKSRTGCAPCRKRRVKCDELHPICSNCHRRDELCIWPNTHRPTLPVPHPQVPLLTTSQSLVIASPPTIQPLFADLTNTVLLHHYTVHTCVYGVRTRQIAALRQILTPKLGFMFPWFFHALLAHAALDLHGLYGIDRPSGDDTDYFTLSQRHAEQAFHRSKKTPAQLAPLESWALLIRFVLTCMQSLFNPAASLAEWKPRILVWIPHCRRLYADLVSEVGALKPGTPLQNTLKIVESGNAGHFGSPSSATSSLSSAGSSSPTLSFASPSSGGPPSPFPLTDSSPQLHPDLSLLHIPWSDIPDPEEVSNEQTSKVYLDAITKLRVAHSMSFTDGYHVPAMLSWPITMSSTFLRFLMERRPRALVLLAHWYVCIYTRVGDHAGFRRFPEDDLDRIYHELDPNWKSWLAKSLSGTSPPSSEASPQSPRGTTLPLSSVDEYDKVDYEEDRGALGLGLHSQERLSHGNVEIATFTPTSDHQHNVHPESHFGYIPEKTMLHPPPAISLSQPAPQIQLQQEVLQTIPPPFINEKPPPTASYELHSPHYPTTSIVHTPAMPRSTPLYQDSHQQIYHHNQQHQYPPPHQHLQNHSMVDRDNHNHQALYYNSHY